MPHVTPGLHALEPQQSVSLLLYDHHAEEVARSMTGWYRFHDRVQPFRELLVEWAPDPADDASAARPQSALLCGGFVEEGEIAAYAGRLDCTFFSWQEETCWSRVRSQRGGAIAEECYWGPDHTEELREAGLLPPPLDPGEVSVVVAGEELRYRGAHAALVCELATRVASVRALVDRICRESGVCVPDPIGDFPDVDYDPQPGDDRDPQLTDDIVDCWLR